ncbi:MAG: BREX-1 system adenine-specific DNA-methyltransferase PglX [Clostridiales bacterium]|nr:BREX-1 system adenine-specific DNA-methyltransferase PglX [Clostridiales bacterium]
MNKTAIKNFAIWARNKLIADISYRAGLMGITESGIAKPLPQSIGATEFYDIGTAEPYSISGHQVAQRSQLVEAIHRKERDTDYKTAYNYIMEEVAYTWFNRLIAVRFMEVNDYLPSHIRVLSSETGKLEPDLVTTPFDADLPFTAQEEASLIQMKQDNNLDEAFRLLFIKQCNVLNEILSALFEVTGHYTELLLNLSVIDQDGVVWHLVHDIDEADFDVNRGGQVEIIGWLYQYYNTEPKDETFALLKKNVKITKERIPSATQLFTPDWIVRYMVENSLGRLWAEGHPNDALKSGWKYYLDEAVQEPDVQAQLEEIRQEYRTLNPEDIRVIDPCMGSGHILVYAFDVLMQIYESQGYTQRDAAQSILQNNLYGLDIDERAAQLAYFAVMMKARQYDRRIFSRGIQPHVYAIVESNGLSGLWTKGNKEMRDLFDVMRDAKEYGSILTVPVLDHDELRRFAQDKVAGIDQFDLETNDLQEQLAQVLALIDVAEMLAGKYQAVVTNPPYMSSSGMGAKLSEFVKKEYPDSKSDMFACFMEKADSLVIKNGYTSLITMESWMFLSSFEKLRNKVNQTKTVINMVHMPYLGKGGTSLGINFGTAAVIMKKGYVPDYNGQYEYTVYYECDENGVPFEFPTKNEHWKTAKQSNFAKIPGSPVAYWVSDSTNRAFSMSHISDYAETKQGLATGENDRFMRNWYEVDISKVEFDAQSREDAVSSKKKWFPYNKGGEYRKWYGNNDYIVNWENDGFEIRNFKDKSGKLRSRPQNLNYYFRSSITWSLTNSSAFGARFKPCGHIFDINGMSLFIDEKYSLYALAFLCSNSCTSFMKVCNPTLASQAGDIARLPFTIDESRLSMVTELTKQNVEEAKNDWDAFETSWDFQRHPLVCLVSTVFTAFDIWQNECNARFAVVKANEIELNRIFINIYGLQGELTPDVDDKDVTVRMADKTRDVKSLLSYAVGCMFGRYSLDVDGLAYAGGEWDASKYSSFIPDADNVIPITDEEYLEDDIIFRLCQWLKAVYGESTLEQNLDFIAGALGNKGDTSREIIRNYFLKDFFKDHCQIYQKRPIYWLFDSGKQNGFKALIYLHRYDADTIGNLRIDYLHRMQRVYESEINRMQDTIDHSGNAREVAQATKRKEKLQKQLKECREYDEKISHLALARIELDLDDGVKMNYEKMQTARDGKKYQVLAKI